jgi:hypothetical protein
MITFDERHKLMRINDSIEVRLNKEARTATVNSPEAAPLTIGASLVMNIVMYSLREGMYNLDELYALSKLAKKAFLEAQEALNDTWEIGE